MLNLSIKTIKKASPQHSLLLQITDENNLLFLQILNLSEQEFLLLKSEQQLRIDFHNFPTKLMEFIELCLNSSKDESINFSCVLDTTKSPDVVFQIVENNEFKSLTHLSLKFRSANDEMLKKYLTAGWKQKVCLFMTNFTIEKRGRGLAEEVHRHMRELRTEE